MAIVDDNLILKLENFRTKVVQMLKEKGISVNEDTKLDDTLIKAIDSISTLQGLEDYISGDIEEYINDDITIFIGYTLASRPSLKKVSINNVSNPEIFSLTNDASLRHFRGENIQSAPQGFLARSLIKVLVLPRCVSTGYQTLESMSYLKYLIMPRLKSEISGGTYFTAQVCDLGSIPTIRDFNINKALLLILRRDVMTSLSNKNLVFSVEEIYVPQDLIEEYKVATNWATYADKFKPLEGSKYEPLNWYEEEDWYKEEMAVWK